MKISRIFRIFFFGALILPLIVPSLLPSFLPPPLLPPQPIEKPSEEVVEEFERDERLQAESDALLPLFDKMPPVPVYLTDEPIIKAGTSTEKGVAYTHCKESEVPSIYVKKAFYQKTNRRQLVNILKHELTHAWLCRQRVMWGHDERFREKFKAVGGFGN